MFIRPTDSSWDRSYSIILIPAVRNSGYSKGRDSMTFLRTTILATAAAALCCCITILNASQPLSQAGTVQKAPDNSNQNKNQNPTADNQSNAQSDRMTTAKIRKAITADKTLSTYAHNVKIITLNGAVTLKGPVTSDEEKQKIAAMAANIVSANKVTDELTVKP
jgi:hyperosmotically inducible protein